MILVCRIGPRLLSELFVTFVQCSNGHCLFFPPATHLRYGTRYLPSLLNAGDLLAKGFFIFLHDEYLR